MGVYRRVVDTGRRAGNLAVVGRRVKVDHVKAVFKKVDAGDKGFVLDAVLVELIWMAVGSCNKDDAMRHQ